MAGEGIDQRSGQPADLVADGIRPRPGRPHAGYGRELGCRPGEGHVDRLSAQVAQLGERPLLDQLVARRERLLDRWITDTRAGIDAVGPQTPAGFRLAESLAFFEFLRAEMPAMLARWRDHQADGRRNRDPR